MSSLEQTRSHQNTVSALCILSLGDPESLPGFGDSSVSTSPSLVLEHVSSLRASNLCSRNALLFRQLHRLLLTSDDLFTTCHNTQLSRVLSPTPHLPDISTEGVEAISHDWEFPGMMYAFPLTPQLTVVLGRIRDSPLPVLLLAPAWLRHLWYSSLIELSIVHAVRLPLE